jgi:hypothetical protein
VFRPQNVGDFHGVNKVEPAGKIQHRRLLRQSKLTEPEKTSKTSISWPVVAPPIRSFAGTQRNTDFNRQDAKAQRISTADGRGSSRRSLAQTEIDADNFPTHTRCVRKTKRRLLFKQNNFS